MSKRRFIQSAAPIMLLLHADKPCVDKAVHWAERLWDKLTERGYGASKAPESRAAQNHYEQLSPRQRDWFDRFWAAFNHKHGRNRAAMRWAQLGELPNDKYQHIVDAAAREAGRQLPQGQSRKMAEGWLADLRWQDYSPKTPKAKGDSVAVERASLHGELVSLRQLHAASPHPSMAERIKAIEEQLQ